LKLASKIKDAYWWIQHRFNPKHQYNVIRLKRLKRGYYDPDTQLFYAMFEVFEDFMKIQLKDPHVVWEYSEEDFPEFMVTEEPESVKREIESRNTRWKEMNEIYDWWVNDYQTREDNLENLPTLPSSWGRLGFLKDEYKDTEEKKEWDRVCKVHYEKEEEWRKKDKEMMHRLVDIHESLWD